VVRSPSKATTSSPQKPCHLTPTHTCSRTHRRYVPDIDMCVLLIMHTHTGASEAGLFRSFLWEQGFDTAHESFRTLVLEPYYSISFHKNIRMFDGHSRPFPAFWTTILDPKIREKGIKFGGFLVPRKELKTREVL